MWGKGMSKLPPFCEIHSFEVTRYTEPRGLETNSCITFTSHQNSCPTCEIFRENNLQMLELNQHLVGFVEK